MKPWHLVENSPVHNAIKEEWKKLLDDKNNTEHKFLSFLKKHAGFFSRGMSFYESVLISELRLGTEHRVDFVLAHGNRSAGFVYTLIELENPNKPAFKKDCTPTAELTHALKQIRDWMQWIKKNSSEVEKTFPSWESNFRYMIIMGRRTDDAKLLQQRNFLSESNGVNIRSFDYLTDLFDRANFKQLINPTDHEMLMTEEQNNEFSNPFYEALSDKNWRDFIEDPTLKTWHIISNNIKRFLDNMPVNAERQDEFLKTLNLDAS